MILIAILLMVCLYLFWYFDEKRRRRNAAHHDQRRDALFDLLNKVRQSENKETETIKKKNDET